MIRKILLFLLCFCLLFASACSTQTPSEGSPAPSASPDASASAETPAPGDAASGAPAETFDPTLVSDALMQTEEFSLQLMQNLRTAYTEGNTLFSPLAFNASMAALYAAAEGDTEEELRRTIRQLRSRIKKIAHAERGLTKALEQSIDSGQISLPLEGGDTA